MLDEKKLVRNCLKKRAGSLDQLYRLFASKMFGICLRYGKNHQEAEDLLHDGFIKVMENLKKFRFEGSLEGWLRRVMVTTAINFYRRNCNFENAFDIDDVSNILPAKADIISSLSTNELLSYLQELPDGYRMIFNMHVVEGYKHKEIAEVLNISENTSKTQLKKAKKALQNRIIEVKYVKAV